MWLQKKIMSTLWRRRNWDGLRENEYEFNQKIIIFYASMVTTNGFNNIKQKLNN